MSTAVGRSLRPARAEPVARVRATDARRGRSTARRRRARDVDHGSPDAYAASRDAVPRSPCRTTTAGRANVASSWRAQVKERTSARAASGRCMAPSPSCRSSRAVTLHPPPPPPPMDRSSSPPPSICRITASPTASASSAASRCAHAPWWNHRRDAPACRAAKHHLAHRAL